MIEHLVWRQALYANPLHADPLWTVCCTSVTSFGEGTRLPGTVEA
jgi:hypothetical protein